MKQNYNNSLALLGHGKWKSALGHTLLIIGMVLISLGVYAQTPTTPPAGLEMHKTWVPNEDGVTGKIVLETYVTGSSLSTSYSIPNDIVIVVDQSGSMGESFGNTTKLAALKASIEEFAKQVKEDAVAHGVNHKIAIVGFASNNYQSYNNSELLYGNNQTNIRNARRNPEDYYPLALMEVNTNLQGNDFNRDIVRAINNISADGGTEMQLGLEMAKGVLDYRTVKTFTANGETHNRGQIVVFFTDGYPGMQPGSNNYLSQTGGTNDSQTVADGAVDYANQLKTGDQYGAATIYSIGVFNGANPEAAYQTDQRGYSNRWYTIDQAANGLLHMISSNYDNKPGTPAAMASSWTNETTSASNVANRFVEHTYIEGDKEKTWTPKYYTAESSDALVEVFKNISDQSGAAAVNLNAETVVQDEVSTNFTLPEGTDISDIELYAVKCTGGTGHFDPQNPQHYIVESCAFNTPGSTNEFGYKTTYNGTTIQYLTLNNNGVVVEGDNLPENRIESTDDILEFGTSVNGNPTISLSGFNFQNMFCGPIIEQQNNQPTVTGWKGRKLVMVIPLEPQGGVWGDGISTNGPLSFVITTSEGQQVYYAFNNPTANILGSVWTEIVTQAPDDYSDDNIDSPEDLAWFISRVNGRIHYNHDNNIASNTTLSGKLTADIDMSAHNWVPIGAGYKCNDQNQYVDANGNVTYKTDPVTGEYVLDNDGNKINVPSCKLAYEGTFDGNGHVITGLKNNADKWFKTASGGENAVVVYPGMFSNVKGNGSTTGIVHDVFILDSDFRGKAHQVDGKGKFIHHGILADTLTGGTIYNCEAAGRMTCNNDNANDANLIYGGLVGLNNGGTIHSSMAMAQLTGYAMGGAVGENRSYIDPNNSENNKVAKFSNSFTNGFLNYIGEAGNNAKEVGGLAAYNKNEGAIIQNCYVRFERSNNSLRNAKFGQLVGNNSATVEKCYTPGTTASTIPSTICGGTAASDDCGTYTDVVSPTRYYYYMNDNQVGGEWTQIGGYNIYANGTPMFEQLNTNRGNNTAWAEWKRTSAGRYEYNTETGYVSGNINHDYPVLKLSQYKCLASTDGISIDYTKNLAEMLHRHNNGSFNENTAMPTTKPWYHGLTSSEYGVEESPAIFGGAINLYANEDMNASSKNGEKEGESTNDYSTAENVVVYIDEDISLLQPSDATATPSRIEAYTGQTIKSFRVGEEGERWHNVSSSLENSKFGWTYKYDNVPHAWGPNWANWQASHTDSKPKDPCVITLNVSDEDHSLFPIDMSNYNWFDFYCFYEPEYHWVNFKRNSNSHWHMDDYTTPITYNNELTGEGNETQFVPGKGYLLSVDMSYYEPYYEAGYDKDYQFLQNRGTLNNGPVNFPVTYTPSATYDLDGYKTGLEGYNLLGNPYQSYLDFDEFVDENSELLENSKFPNTYAVYDPESGNYIQYLSGSSVGSETASRYINMHQGFFIQVNPENAEESFTGTATFTNDMRTNATDDQTGFRGEQPAYPLINFTVTDYEGETDLAVLELNRPENNGAKKLRMGSPAGRIYFRYDNTNLAIYFRNSDKDYQTLNFAAEEDGNFTLNWNMANANFSSLTLVDNITGIKTDMLTHDHYTFEGRVDDYNTRFKIVFGEMDTNEEEPVLEHFAFFDHGNLIVNGTGHFEVVDVLGRVVYATELTDTQNTVSLPSNVRGVCMLCFTRNNETKVQKMVIQ